MRDAFPIGSKAPDLHMQGMGFVGCVSRPACVCFHRPKTGIDTAYAVTIGSCGRLGWSRNGEPLMQHIALHARAPQLLLVRFPEWLV
jgi:hypothetical protein